MQLCLVIAVAHKCFALLIVFDNINTVCEIGLQPYQNNMHLHIFGIHELNL